MPSDLFLNKKDFLNAAQYVYKGILSQPSSLEKVRDDTLYLLRNGEVQLRRKNEAVPAQSEIVKTLYHPQKSLAYFMIKVALVPLIVEFYAQVFPDAPISKMLKTLSEEEITSVQRMLLFHELKQGPLEYFKYCNNHRLYHVEKNFYEDCLVLAKMDHDLALHPIKEIFTGKGLVQPESLSAAKLALMEEATRLAKFAVFIDDGIEPILKLVASHPNAMRSLVALLQTLSEMAQKLGLHQREFVETSPSVLKSITPSCNLREKLIREPCAYSSKLFDFCSEGNGMLDLDVLLAYQVLTSVELPDFKHLAKSYVHQEENREDESFSDLAEFSPAAELNKARKKRLP